MRIRLLPSRPGQQSQLQSLTTFVINDQVAVDAGSVGLALDPEEMVRIRHVVITHTHSDHTASLPIFIAEAFTSLEEPIIIYALPEAIRALREFVFNDQIWPDFEKIPLMNGNGPTIKFQPIEPRKSVNIGGLDIMPIPVNHIVPTVGLMLRQDSAVVALTSDTYTTDEIWQVARGFEDLKAVFVDVSFPNELDGLAAASKHLTPELLASELKKLDREVEVYAVHIKPTNREEVIRQLCDLNNPLVSVAELGRVYEW